MNRQEMEERLVDFLYDELEPAERERFEASLSEHPELQAEVASHLATRSMLASSGALAEVQMPPGLLDGVMREARAVASSPEEPTTEGWLARLLSLLMQPAMAAVLLVMLVAGTSIFLARRGGQSAEVMPSVAALEEPEAPPTPTGAEPPELAEAAAGEAFPAEVEAPEGQADEPVLAEGAAIDETAAANDELRAVADGAVARLQPLDDSASGGDVPAARPATKSQVASAESRPRPSSKPAEPRRLAAKTKALSKDSALAQAERADKERALEEASYAARQQAKGYVARGGEAAVPPAKPSATPQSASAGASRDERESAEEASAAEAPRDPMQVIREEAAAIARPADRGAYLLSKVDRFAAQGREDLVDQTLALLEKVDGWEQVARSRRSAAVARRARGAGAGPPLAPSDADSKQERKAAEPMPLPASKKSSGSKATRSE